MGDKLGEIGITKINKKGEVLDTLETLINPNRDVGPDKVKFLRYGLFRYQNQAHHVEVVLPDGATRKNGISSS